MAAPKTWKLLWAKSEPFHPLWKHLLDATAVSLALPNPLEREGWPRETAALLVGLHDVGKADPTFQRMHQAYRPILEAAGFALVNDSGKRHERVSAHLIRQAVLIESANERLAESAAMAIAAHHGHWESGGHESGECFETAKRELTELLQSLLGEPSIAPSIPADLSAFGMRLAGHVVLCDWIASNEAFFKREELDAIDDPADYFEKAKRVAVEMVRTLDLLPDSSPSEAGKIVEAPRPLQRTLLEARLPPGMVVIEAPMGEGKTEAAWILAEQWREAGYGGMYMALPTQATGDALFERYDRDYLRLLGRSGKVHLIHGMAWLRDEKEPDEPFVTYGEREEAAFAAQWFRPTRRAMLAAHGAGTIDQFLLAGLNARFGFLRLYGLDRRVLVIDEAHAYDAYMTAILARGLTWCRAMQIPVVLLSATLSAAQRAQLLEAYGAKGADPGPAAAYPLVTHVSFGGEISTLTPVATAQRTLALTPHTGLLANAAGTARLAEQLATDGKCVCVIVNTVRQAQAVYQELNLGEAEKGLFHARFTAKRRQEIAEEVIACFGKDRSKRPSRFVLVATQVVEQSLDVDFDEMLSEIAPIDLLLQRSGRLHRHRPRACPPELRVLLPAIGDLSFGGTEWVYDRYVLLKTLMLVAGGRDVTLPDDFRPLIEAVYGEETIPEGVVAQRELEAARLKWTQGTEEMEAAAAPFLLQEPRARLFRPVNNTPVGDDSDDGNGWRAKTRLGANDRTCLFVLERNLERTRKGDFPGHVVRAEYGRTVRVPSYVELFRPAPGHLAAVEAEGNFRGLVLIPHSGEKEWASGKHKLKYDDVLGLTVEKA